jgi:alpha-L-fucosidase
LRSGARFAGPVAIHHDNFAMWDSDVTRWNIARTAGVDITGKLEKAIRKRGMKFMASFHHAFSWWYFTPSYQFDGADPEFADLYCRVHTFNRADDSFEEYPDSDFENLWYEKLEEVLLKYHPDLVWFDMGLELLSEDIRKKAVARIFNLAEERNQEVEISYKIKFHAPMPPEAGVVDFERGRANRLLDRPWLTDTSTSSWFYNNNRKPRSSDELIDILIDIVSKNGCLLLNVPPKADGAIPEDVKTVLLEIGDWLRVNGPAIYDTRPWLIYGEGPTQMAGDGHFAENETLFYHADDIRFTQSKDGTRLYVIVLGRPDGFVLVNSLKADEESVGNIRSIQLLGYEGNITWDRVERGLKIHFPSEAACQSAYAFEISLQ